MKNDIENNGILHTKQLTVVVATHYTLFLKKMSIDSSQLHRITCRELENVDHITIAKIIKDSNIWPANY